MADDFESDGYLSDTEGTYILDENGYLISDGWNISTSGILNSIVATKLITKLVSPELKIIVNSF